MRKPLGLPPGSVRALLLLGLVARAVLDLRATGNIANWLLAAIVMSAAAYFSGRSAANKGTPGVPDEPVRRTHPLGLPAGTVRTLFLLGAAYGAWLFFQEWRPGKADTAVLWILGAFGVGVLARFLLTRAQRPPDAGTHWVWHLQALTVLLALGGLIAIAATGKSADVPAWVEPVLAAGSVYYFATR